MQEVVSRAKELLADGTVARVLGWKAGDLPYNPEPAYFEKEEDFENFVYKGFCGANLSKYMIEASKLEGKTLVCLKPVILTALTSSSKEHRVDRDKAYIISVGCKGKLDIEKIKSMGIKESRTFPVRRSQTKQISLPSRLSMERKHVLTRMPCWRDAMCAREKSIRSTMK